MKPGKWDTRDKFPGHLEDCLVRFAGPCDCPHGRCQNECGKRRQPNDVLCKTCREVYEYDQVRQEMR